MSEHVLGFDQMVSFEVEGAEAQLQPHRCLELLHTQCRMRMDVSGCERVAGAGPWRSPEL